MTDQMMYAVIEWVNKGEGWTNYEIEPMDEETPKMSDNVIMNRGFANGFVVEENLTREEAQAKAKELNMKK